MQGVFEKKFEKSKVFCFKQKSLKNLLYFFIKYSIIIMISCFLRALKQFAGQYFLIRRFGMDSVSIERLVSLLVRALVLFTAFPVHESAHGLSAYWLGDDTAKKEGRITLNPLKHVTLFGALFMLFAGVGVARPAPINAARFKNPKIGMALSCLAGPLSNLILAYLSVLFYRILTFAVFMTESAGVVTDVILYIFSYGAILNIGLAVFNLLPIPPLDGSRIVTVFLPAKNYFNLQKYEMYIFAVFFVVMLSGILDRPLAIMNEYVMDAMFFLTDWIDKILILFLR